MKTAQDIAPSDLFDTVQHCAEQIMGSVCYSCPINFIELPDGRRAQVQIVVTTDEFEFI